jgi:hypothetical protein
MIDKMIKLENETFASTKIFLMVLLLYLGAISPVLAQTKPDSVAYKLYPFRIDQDFTINGKLTNPAWNHAQAVFLTHEVIPSDQVAAPVKTKVKVLYSDNYLYIGFWASDPHPSKIRAHITDRDEIGGDDFVGIFLSPFQSNQHGYTLAVNPRGIQLDAKRTSHGGNGNFDMLWYSKGAVSDSGYTAVMKIPFESLHFPEATLQNWSINFLRIYPRNKRYIFTWTDVSLGNSCILCQDGRITGLSGIKNSNPVDIIPYALGYKSSALNDPGNPASGLNSGPIDGRIGGTIIWSPNSTSSIDATINPDFSQVETDATQISVNKTFALYYSEKRPFFMKEANLFQTGYDLFYSRTINRPWAAGKFTQNTKNYSVAFLTAYDRNTPYIIPGLLGSSTVKSDVNAYDNILRGKVNFGSQSYVGGLLSTRNETNAHNYVGSIDWNFFLGHHFYFSGAGAYSNTQELNDTTLFNDPRRFGRSRFDAAFNGQQFGGTFLTAEFQREAKYYSFDFDYTSLSPTFQAQNGFITNTDQRQYAGSQEVDYYPNASWISHGGVYLSGMWRYDFANVLQERYVQLEWYNHFAGQTQLSLSYLPLNDEQFRGRFFTQLHRASIDLYSNPVKFLSFEANLETGRDIYRVVNPKYGHGYNFMASATIKPMPRLQLDLSYQYSTLSSLDDKTKFYSGSISRLEAHYNFSRHLFFRLITQYNTFTKQVQVYPLLSYKLNPFTKFYIGTTDNLQHVNRVGPPQINAYRQINREFFIKVQYLIRK